MRQHPLSILSCLSCLSCLVFCIASTSLAAEEKQKPLFKDFIGINGHYKFDPALYSQVCRLARMYHNMNWDVKNIGDPITIPICANKVHWKGNVYGPWKKHGLETDICMQFGTHGPNSKDPKDKSYIDRWMANEKWAYDYGFKMAEYFGPAGKENLCTSIEFGNEPGKRFDEATYKKLFKQVAQGIRDADSAVKIVTATTHARAPDDYSLDIRSTYTDKDIVPLYDVINIHTYAQIQRTNNRDSPWDRSYPEDDSIVYLEVIDEMIEWRDKNAKGKEIWVTEFGYDCVTEAAMKKRKDWTLKLNWQGTTDRQQAQYILRSLFVFAERDIDRAYIYFFDDNDNPGVHAGAGLTRKGVPKQSFWTVKQCYEILGDYRFHKIIQKEDDAYVYEFTHADDKEKTIWVAWSPTGTQTNKKDGYVEKSAEITLKKLPGYVSKVDGMITGKGKHVKVDFKAERKQSLTLTIGESPCYIFMGPKK